MMVRRAYAICKWTGRVERVLVDSHGLVFFPGDAWRTVVDGYRFVYMPGTEIFDRWPSADWWMKSWQDTTWSWCYGFKNTDLRVVSKV